MQVEKVAFDTLGYAKRLCAGGIENADVHAESLCATITQNIYLKFEVDKMIEEALKRFDERTLQIRAEMKAEANELRAELRSEISSVRLEMRDMRIDLERKIGRMTFNVVTILGGLYIFVGAVTNFIHLSFH